MSVFKVYSEKYKKRLSMDMVFTSKVESNKKRNVLFKGNSIQDFIVIYGNLPDISLLVANRDNSTHLLQLFRDFLRLIDHVVMTDMHLPMLNDEQKEKAIEYIERHLFLKLYSRYGLFNRPHRLFPLNCSEKDNKLYTEFKLNEDKYKDKLAKLGIEGICIMKHSGYSAIGGEDNTAR